METADIINAWLAGLTLLGILTALGIGIWNILVQKNLPKLLSRKELLDEIEQWVWSSRDIPMAFSRELLRPNDNTFKDARMLKRTIFFKLTATADLYNDAIRKGTSFVSRINFDDTLRNSLVDLIKEIGKRAD